MQGKLRRSIPAIALSVFSLGLVSSWQPASATTITGGGYTASDITYGFTDISSSGTQILAGQDNGSQTVALPFAFNFFGTSYSSLQVSTNGLATFGNLPTNSQNPTDLNGNLSGNAGPVIAPLWSDWTTDATSPRNADAIYYQTQGSGPNQQFIIQWNQVGSAAGSDAGANKLVTFQAILYQGSNKIRFNYLDTFVGIGSPRNDGANSTIGIRNSGNGSNVSRLQWAYSSTFSTYTVEDGTSICYAPGTLTAATCP